MFKNVRIGFMSCYPNYLGPEVPVILPFPKVRYVSFVVYGRMSSSHLVVTEFPRKMFNIPIFMAVYITGMGTCEAFPPNRSFIGQYFQNISDSLGLVNQLAACIIRCLYIQNNRPPTRGFNSISVTYDDLYALHMYLAVGST